MTRWGTHRYFMPTRKIAAKSRLDGLLFRAMYYVSWHKLLQAVNPKFPSPGAENALDECPFISTNWSGLGATQKLSGAVNTWYRHGHTSFKSTHGPAPASIRGFWNPNHPQAQGIEAIDIFRHAVCAAAISRDHRSSIIDDHRIMHSSKVQEIKLSGRTRCSGISTVFDGW